MATNSTISALEKEQVNMCILLILLIVYGHGGDLICGKSCEQIFGMAEKEMEYKVDLFNRYKESELNMGENSCIDRCVSKYWQVS
ncbi:hypothetical protein RJ639_031988 [Escallonia herrerae]|uniref:Mitochondrial import inner membrane translocase subunit n=1 Tax=Escallonia herrerae TaxID=1293975 RepID=A0AA88X1K5_9ASTE|nr:hypothetical protein RJ639_031988 [Escallonia herrerae]